MSVAKNRNFVMPDREFRDAIYRPNRSNLQNMPMGARSVGHYRITRFTQEPVKTVDFLQVFWGIEGSGTFLYPGKKPQLMQPDQIAVYFPGIPHHLKPAKLPWEYRWWTIDGPVMVDMAKAFGLTSGVKTIGPCPAATLDQLAEAIQDLSFAGELRASSIAYELFSFIIAPRSAKHNDPLIQKAISHIQANWHNGYFNINTLAAQLQVNRSALSRRFKAIMGVPLQEYLLRLRVQNAVTQLERGGKRIHEIAEANGFNDPDYFSRVIHKRLGRTPRSFRITGQ
jgi:AraC-like DNA-binding protein